MKFLIFILNENNIVLADKEFNIVDRDGKKRLPKGVNMSDFNRIIESAYYSSRRKKIKYD